MRRETLYDRLFTDQFQIWWKRGLLQGFFLVSLHDLIVPLPVHHGPRSFGRQHEMLRLQVRLDATMRAKGRKWCHGLGKPITDITKHGVRLTPPKLQLIPFHSLTARADNIRNLR